MMITKHFKDATAAENARYTAELSETLYALSALEEQTRKITGAYPHSGLGDIKRQQMMGGVRNLNRLFERHFQGMRENLLDYYGLLIARGLMDSNSIHQFIISPVEAHSKKPDEAREKIVALMGDVPRVELFARQAAPGWQVWGNEVESTIDFWPSWPEVEEVKIPCHM